MTWHKESYRHYLAGKGIKTNRYMALRLTPRVKAKYPSIATHLPSSHSRSPKFVHPVRVDSGKPLIEDADPGNDIFIDSWPNADKEGIEAVSNVVAHEEMHRILNKEKLASAEFDYIAVPRVVSEEGNLMNPKSSGEIETSSNKAYDVAYDEAYGDEYKQRVKDILSKRKSKSSPEEIDAFVDANKENFKKFNKKIALKELNSKVRWQKENKGKEWDWGRRLGRGGLQSWKRLGMGWKPCV